MIELARKLFDSGNYDQLFKLGTITKDLNDEFLNLLIRASLREKRPDTAYKYFKRYQGIDRDILKFRIEIMKNGKLRKKLEIPESFDLYLLLAREAMDQGYVHHAKYFNEEALKYAQGHQITVILHNLANNLWELGETEKALELNAQARLESQSPNLNQHLFIQRLYWYLELGLPFQTELDQETTSENLITPLKAIKDPSNKSFHENLDARDLLSFLGIQQFDEFIPNDFEPSKYNDLRKVQIFCRNKQGSRSKNAYKILLKAFEFMKQRDFVTTRSLLAIEMLKVCKAEERPNYQGYILDHHDHFVEKLNLKNSRPEAILNLLEHSNSPLTFKQIFEQIWKLKFNEKFHQDLVRINFHRMKSLMAGKVLQEFQGVEKAYLVRSSTFVNTTTDSTLLSELKTQEVL